MLFGDPGMVRKIDKITGNISRVAGNGLTFFSGDAAGIVVSSQIIDDKIAHPDISSQPNGIYLVTLTTDKDTEFQKIILIH